MELVNHDNVCLFEFSCQIDWGFDFVGVEGFASQLFEVELHRKLTCQSAKSPFDKLSYRIWGTALTVVFQSLQSYVIANNNICNENFNLKSRNGHASLIRAKLQLSSMILNFLIKSSAVTTDPTC